MHLVFRNLSEEQPGDAWRRVFAHAWPGWRQWFEARDSPAAPDLAEARSALRRHMPEFERLWDRLVASADADEIAARFLSFWTPPRYLVHCSQAVMIDADGPLLIRNYDMDPRLNESTLLRTAWHGRRVMGMVEGMAGLADGMNDAGLAASLTFGGRVKHGKGFGVPLILRYVLETCTDTSEAVAALRAVPCHMSYNITVLDRNCRWATVFLAPDRPAIITRSRFATNHQLGVEWPRHARVSNTLREQHLRALLTLEGLEADTLADNFTQAPLFSTNYTAGFGTVYTAAYRPATGEVTLRWRDGEPRRCSFDDFERDDVRVDYTPAGSCASTGPWQHALALGDTGLHPRAGAADTELQHRARPAQNHQSATPGPGQHPDGRGNGNPGDIA